MSNLSLDKRVSRRMSSMGGVERKLSSRMSQMFRSSFRGEIFKRVSTINTGTLNHNKLSSQKIVDEKLKLILCKDKQERNEDEIEYAFKVLKEITIFKEYLKKYGSDLVKSFIKCLILQEAPENSTVFNTGEQANSCFILLEGLCQLLLPSGLIVDLVQPGDLIGDKVLVGNEMLRNDVRTLLKCIFVEIKKKDFMALYEVMRKIEITEQNQFFTFFKSIKLFANCNRGYLEKFLNIVTSEKFEGGDIVINQNDLIENIYIIKKGLFNVLYKTKRNLDVVFDLNYFSEINSNDMQRFSESRLHELKGYKQTEDIYKLLVLGKGEFFGEMELIQNLPNSYFTLKSIQKNSEVLVCKREKFSACLRQYFNVDLFKIFEEQVKEKIANYKERLSNLKNQMKLSEHSTEYKLNANIMERVMKDNKIKSERKKYQNLEELKIKPEKSAMPLQDRKVKKISNKEIYPNEEPIKSKIETVEDFKRIKSADGIKAFKKPNKITSPTKKKRNRTSIIHLNDSGNNIGPTNTTNSNLKIKIKTNSMTSSTNFFSEKVTSDKKRDSTCSNIKPYNLKNFNTASLKNSPFISSKKKNEKLFIMSTTNFMPKLNTGIISPSINMNVNIPFYEKNSKTILNENSKFKFSECAEINKNFFLDNENISNVLRKKYNFIKENNKNFLGNGKK